MKFFLNQRLYAPPNPLKRLALAISDRNYLCIKTIKSDRFPSGECGAREGISNLNRFKYFESLVFGVFLSASWKYVLFLQTLFIFQIAFVQAQDKPGTPDAELVFPPGVEKPKYEKRTVKPLNEVEFRVDPPHWWVGMNDREVQLMIYDKNVGRANPELNYKGVKVARLDKIANPNYLFVTLSIDPETAPGRIEIKLKGLNYNRTIEYELKRRRPGNEHITPVGKNDVVYLIMPDRFANGDTSNDIVKGMQQEEIDRSKMYYRHGGDIQGILDNLDYIQDLGFTTIWLNPVQTNDQPYASYHGYAITDHYEIDPRFGDIELYNQLSEELHRRGMKLIMDIVHNHTGDQHFFIQDLPSNDWIHQPDTFMRSNFRDPVIIDPYASDYDFKQMNQGWFDNHMPDLNQRHPHLAKYLTQNNIWWIENSGLDGYRIDTYFYPDPDFMIQWTKDIKKEYPDFYLVGEVWVHTQPILASFTEGNNIKIDKPSSELDGVTDFAVYYGLVEALTRDQGWMEGVSRLYYTLAQDFFYKDAARNMLFIDNHDISRFLSVVNGNVVKLKSALAFIYTMRGIPCVYYGTELLFTGFTDPDGKVRQDMPGGWKEDSISVFAKEGRTHAQQDLVHYISKLNELRRIKSSLIDGNMTHFIPANGVYYYARYTEYETILVVLNTSPKDVKFDWDRVKEMWSNENLSGMAVNLITEEEIECGKPLNVSPFSTMIIELLD